MSKYHRALQSRKPITELPEGGYTRAEHEAAIASISATLRGPLSNTERVMLVHDRQDHRDILALMDKREATNAA